MQTEEQRKKKRRAYEKKYMYERYGIVPKKKITGKHYQYVHKETGRLFGLPVKLTRKEYRKIKKETFKFMAKRGFELKEVPIMKEVDTNKDKHFQDLEYDGFAMGVEHDPGISYLADTYRFSLDTGKVASRHAS